MFYFLLLAFTSTTTARPALAAAARTFTRRVLGASDVLRAGVDPAPGIAVVTDFGALGDGTTDNTAAFSAAIASLSGSSSGSGGVVYVPSGQFSFSSVVPCGTAGAASICLTRGVSLVGTFETVPSHNVGQHGSPPINGSILCPRAGRGNESGPPFIAMPEDTTVRGFSIWYPDVLGTQAPVPYPYTIFMQGDNPAVQDVEFLNSWNAISAVGAHRHYLARLQGQPTNIGIFVDQTYDIGRIEDVHWNPWFSSDAAYIAHQTTQGVGFLIARTDWEYVLNTFVFAMSIGYQFVESPTGSCNGNFVGIGADCCANASVRVDSADPWGISIVNGEFTSFSGGFGPDVADHTQLVVSASNKGAVRLVSSSFWGPSNQIATVAGSGSVGFESCIFNTWDAVKQGRAAIQVTGGDVMVRGCDFQSAHPGGQVLLLPGTKKAIVAHNIVTGPLNFTDLGAKTPVIKDNAGD